MVARWFNLKNNASYASLEPYTPQNITKMIYQISLILYMFKGKYNLDIVPVKIPYAPDLPSGKQTNL